MQERITVWVQRFKDRKNLMLQWLDPETGDRKTRSAGTADPTLAEHARGDLEADLNHGRPVRPARLGWHAFCRLVEEEFLPGRRANTQKNYRITIRLFEKLCKPSRLDTITERTLSRFAARLRRRKGGQDGRAAAGTVRVRLQFLHSLLCWAADQKLLAAVPLFPVVRVPRKSPRPVPVESFASLAGHATTAMMRTFLLCGWLAGLRLAEAAALEWEETSTAPYLDLPRQRIIFPAEFVKGVEDQWVPLDPQLRQALLDLPREGCRVFRFLDDGGRPLRASAIGARIRRLAERAGLRMTMKTLRRGFGCRYAGQVPAQVLQKLMRHSSITTTMTFYANVDLAVEEAVLGPRCNSKRNSTRDASPTMRPDKT